MQNKYVTDPLLLELIVISFQELQETVNVSNQYLAQVPNFIVCATVQVSLKSLKIVSHVTDISPVDVPLSNHIFETFLDAIDILTADEDVFVLLKV